MYSNADKFTTKQNSVRSLPKKLRINLSIPSQRPIELQDLSIPVVPSIQPNQSPLEKENNDTAEKAEILDVPKALVDIPIPKLDNDSF